MSLLLQKSQKRLTLPENAEIMVAQSPELSMFLQNLERPIGIIKIGEEASHAVASEYSEQLRAIVTNLGRIAAQGNGLPVRHNENLVTSGNTEYGDEVVSVLSERKIGGAHLVDSLIVVEQQFVFGHHHLVRTLANKTRIERQAGPIDEFGFNNMQYVASPTKQNVA